MNSAHILDLELAWFGGSGPMTLRTWELGCFRRRRSGVGHPTRVLLPPHEGAVCLTEGAGNLTLHQLPRNSGPMLSSDELLRACHSAGRPPPAHGHRAILPPTSGTPWPRRPLASWPTIAGPCAVLHSTARS